MVDEKGLDFEAVRRLAAIEIFKKLYAVLEKNKVIVAEDIWELEQEMGVD